MQIRLASQEDIPEICHIYELAREHMKGIQANGKSTRMKQMR